MNVSLVSSLAPAEPSIAFDSEIDVGKTGWTFGRLMVKIERTTGNDGVVAPTSYWLAMADEVVLKVLQMKLTRWKATRSVEKREDVKVRIDDQGVTSTRVSGRAVGYRRA